MSTSRTARPLTPSLDGLWAVIAVVLPAVAAMFSKTLAVDLAYQIRAGDIMLDTHRVLDVDTFTYTVFGQRWLNQQWGAQVVMAIVHRAAGWAGIILLSGILVGLTAFFIYRSCRAVGSSPRTAALLTIAGCLVGIEILRSMRPQQFGFMLFAACLWLVTTRRSSPLRLWLIPMVVLVWANLHGSFPLVFVLLGLAWLRDRKEEPARARSVLVVAAVSAVATLVNPYGVHVWNYVFDLSTHPVVSRKVSEWGPPSIHTPTGAMFFISLFAVVLLLARRAAQVPWLTLLTLGIFAALSLLAIRGVIWWALAAPVVVAATLRDGDRARPPTRSPINLVFAVALAVLVATALPFRRGIDPESGGPAVLSLAPERLVSAARESVQPGSHAFVSQLLASWSEYSAPELPVAVDSRIEIFPESVWDDYFVVSSGREGWEEVLDRWDVSVLILEPDQAVGLLQVIVDHPEWRLVQQDRDGFVYVRA